MNFNFLNSTDLLGLCAGIFTTIAFLPQVIKTWQSKSAEDVSLTMFIFFILGVILWCAYGWQIHSIPVMIANVITFILSTIILTLKLIFANSLQDDK
ncbi:SemiSWEET transporter [Prochlorococcus sp. MIT 1307]|uniref:SemiSWEET family sugar transporter n=1 Tax=Prochlorococcus sp. MIT 1307 TaxID=3096219 RepID=UPI002A75AF3C|nr:SemiSWEET transporter [Prochlorococcus sp. MIT 1307]